MHQINLQMHWRRINFMRNVLEMMMILIIISWWFLIKLIVGYFNENIEIKIPHISPQLEKKVHNT